jgi:2-methylcitrate dehydratase
MSPLQTGAPPPLQARDYDPEIKDIASYVHNTPITSELAVSYSRLLGLTPLIDWVVRHRSIRLPRHPWLRS